MNCNVGQTTILNISRVWRLRGKCDLRLGRLQPADRWPLHGAEQQSGLLCWGLKDQSEDLLLGSRAGRGGLGLDLWVAVLPLPSGSAVLEPHLKTHRETCLTLSVSSTFYKTYGDKGQQIYFTSADTSPTKIFVTVIVMGMSIENAFL